MAQEGRTVGMRPNAGENAPYLYPTVPVPASVFARLSGIMPPVEGDALADTEALYDE